MNESFRKALNRGFNPREYTYGPLPQGEWLGTLDAKIWGKSLNLVCYFTSREGSKFCLSAFRVRTGKGAGKWYTPKDGNIDVSNEAIRVGNEYKLHTGRNNRNNPAWYSIQEV